MAFSSGNSGTPAAHPPPSSDGGLAALPKSLRLWAIICFAVAGVFALSQLAEIPARSALRGYDNTFNYLWLRSAMVDGDWDFRNDLELCDTLPPEYRASALALPLTPAGRLPNKYGVGWAVLSVPFYLVADAIVAAGRALGLWSLARDGWNPVYQISLQLGHLALAALALRLAVRVVARWLGTPRESAPAWVGVLLVWAASPLFYYQTVNVSMSHGAAFFAVTLLAYALARATSPETALSLRTPLWWLVAGAGWGLAVTTRFQLGVFGLLAAPAWWQLWRQRRDVLRPLAFFAFGAFPLVALQLFAWRTVYGHWFVFSYGAEGESFHWLQPAALRSLFSPWHGLLYWHPFLVVPLLGLALWARRKSPLALVLLAVVALTLYANAAWWCWWFASAFGSRSFDAALLPLMAALAWLWRQSSPRVRTTLVSIAIAAGVGNFYLLLLYRIGAISRSDPVTWAQMLAAAEKIPAALTF